MDAGNRPSGIPRVSRLPVLSKRSSQRFDQTQVQPQEPAAAPRLAKRTSIASLPRYNRDGLPATAAPRTTVNGRPSITRPRDSFRKASLGSSTSSLVPPSPATTTSFTSDEDSTDRLGSSYDELDSSETPTPRALPATKVRKARPSLSDRAIESIHAIPSTPKDRRQSNFFHAADSPMAPPPLPRPSSVISNDSNSRSRPGTSDGTFVKPAPPTAVKMPMSAKPLSRSTIGFGFSQQSTPRSTSLTNKLHSARKVKAEPQPLSTATESRSSNTSRTASSKGESLTSSSALRQQIAAAKAAAKQGRDHLSLNETTTFDGDADPFNQAPKDGKHILRNRIRTARLDGKLNISALQLTTIPEEVMTMYTTAAIEDSKISWAELVDLTRIIAADNELETIADNIFPDLGPHEFDAEEDGQAGQFGGVELLDLHSNVLTSLPLGLRRLERLTSLNVTHNKLDNTSLDVICQIATLKELRIGHNNISGTLPSALCAQLASLEVLDLQANRLLALPEAIQELTALRVLNVSANQLTSLPMDALTHISLQELYVNGNALIASLFPLGGVSQHKTLRVLDLANNSLAALTFSPELDMPELQSLDVTNNHLTVLPPLQGWSKLITLNVGDNKIAEIPKGFTELRKLRNANLSGNDLHLLPPEIALMECLTTFILASNPLRHKKYLTMSAADIKQDLRGFLKPGTDDYDDETASYGTAPEGEYETSGHTWALKPGGVLDLSNKGLTDNVNDSLGSFLKSNEVRQLNLHGNKLTTIPPALWLGQDLRVLDLSDNPLEVDYLTDDLDLPSLVEVRMATCRITRLEPLVEHLRAPELQTMQINGNRLSGPVPDLHTRYPQLLTLLASDNKFESVSANALRGYNTVDLTSNELQNLPPEIGLLWEEGLKSFEVGRNAFRVPGYRVLEKGTQATMRWLQDRIKVGAERDM